MIGDKIASVGRKLTELAGKVDSETWGIIRACRAELLDAELAARGLEGQVVALGNQVLGVEVGRGAL